MIVLGAAVAVLSHLMAELPEGTAPLPLGRASVFVLTLASGFFLASGVLRLARWRLAGEAYTALAGAALLVMGGLCLPLGGFALLFPSLGEPSLIAPLTRTLAVLVVVTLLVRAMTSVDVPDAARPSRLVPRMFALVLAVFVGLVVAQEVALGNITDTTLPVVLLAGMRAVGWFAVAAYAASRSARLPWAARVAPLLLGMGVAETLRGFDLGQSGTWTFGALLLCLSMSALSARSALLDLDSAVTADEHHRTDLTHALTRVRDEAVELSEWREQLTHDARNACAGLRAALGILERHDGRIDAATRERLRRAATQELGHIEHLLTRSADEPCVPFEVTEVVQSVARAAWAVGARVSIQGLPVHAVGRPDDLAAALKQLLVNAEAHAPGSQVRLTVTADDATVSVTCADDGPGVRREDRARAFERGYRGRTSTGSGLGLHAARELMRGQDGELTLDSSAPGATFELTLRRAPVRHLHPVRVPAQRPAHSTAYELPVA